MLQVGWETYAYNVRCTVVAESPAAGVMRAMCMRFFVPCYLHHGKGGHLPTFGEAPPLEQDRLNDTKKKTERAMRIAVRFRARHLNIETPLRHVTASSHASERNMVAKFTARKDGSAFTARSGWRSSSAFSFNERATPQ